MNSFKTSFAKKLFLYTPSIWYHWPVAFTYVLLDRPGITDHISLDHQDPVVCVNGTLCNHKIVPIVFWHEDKFLVDRTSLTRLKGKGSIHVISGWKLVA